MTDLEIGRFFHHGWEVAAHADPLRVRVASWHEFGHAALNSSTAWGGLLQQLAIAGRLAGDRVPPGGLGSAVAAARSVHEAYATQVSRSALVGRAEEVDGFLSGQAGYRRFVRIAERVGPTGASAEPWRDGDGLGTARMAALVACMQSPAVARLLDVGTERFRLAEVPGADWPDRRLRTLVRLAPQLWAALGPPASADTGFVQALDAAADALQSAGHPTLSREDYAALLPALTADLNRLVPGSGGDVELDLAADTGIPGLFGTETVRVRPPLPTAVVAELDPTSVADLRTPGVTPHLFLTVRRMRALRVQYDLRPDPGLPDDEPVVAVLTPHRNGTLRLTLPADPAEIDQVAAEELTVTCLSLDCLRDEVWCERWLPTLRARTRVVGLLDLPPEAMIHAWLGAGEPLRVQLLGTTVTGGLESALVFRLADEEPVILPVTPASLTALVILTERASGGSVTLQDDVLDDVGTAIARIVLDHVVTEDAVRPFLVSR
jgi:hypothetical protein